MSGSVISVRNITKSFSRGPEMVHAVSHLDLDLFPGELVALIGPSGSGKTTLLNLLSGWEEPDGGTIQWKGSQIASLGDLAWHELGLVPQSLGLMGELSIRENVALPERLARSTPPEPHLVATLLEELGLEDLADRVPAEVSLGEQQRAAIARALLCHPSLLLTDEPSGHQDAVWARRVFKALRKACDGGTCCLVATHNEEVLGLVDRFLEIRDGEVVAKSGRPPRETEAPR